MHRCALYLRSSKDRADASIDAQRRELKALAASKGLEVAAEFADAVERADDWERPGFAGLLRAVADPARGWANVLVLDASRIARSDELLGATFRHECKKRGVTIVYSKFPSINPMTDLMVQTVDQLIAKMHSMMSREKGLAGMAENVRRGFRAGGRAPIGYRLERVETGAVREGKPVTKSRLVPDDKAPAIARYLKGRAEGLSATTLARECGLQLKGSTLAGIDWQALTYAGHTVWNVQRGRTTRGDGQAKRRPRSEWQIQPDTHLALITTDEADRILERLQGKSSSRMRGADYLFSGILVAPNGARWHGDRDSEQRFYRCGRRRLAAKNLERQLLDKLGADIADDRVVARLLQAARAAAKPERRNAELLATQRRIDELARQAGRLRNLLPTMKHPEALTPKLDEIETEKRQLEAHAAVAVEAAAAQNVLAMITETDVRTVLASLGEGLATLDRAFVKARLRGLLEKITLDPTDLTCCLHYAIPALAGVSVASPQRGVAIPAIRLRRHLTLYGFRRAA